MILPMTILSIDVEESSDRRKSAKNRRYSLFCLRPEVVFRVGESTSRHSSGLFSVFTRGRATKSLTMMFAVMRNGMQTDSSFRKAHSESKNSSKHADRVRLSECKNLRKVLSKRFHQFHYQDTG